MKPYPSIPHAHKFLNQTPALKCIAFKKYDGSNLRFEWNRKTGWYKFGTRTRLFDNQDTDFGAAIPLFLKQFAPSLTHTFEKVLKCENAIAYCEWFGPNSFAGHHVQGDPMQLVLIDVNIHKKGIISPDSFVKIFSNIVPSAEVFYCGALDEDFFKSIRSSPLSFGEGVMCKGGERHELWMCKIKTNAYLAELRKRFGEEWVKYWE